MYNPTARQLSVLRMFTEKPRAPWQRNLYLSTDGVDGTIWASNGAALLAIPVELDDFVTDPLFWLDTLDWKPVDFPVPDFNSVLDRAKNPSGVAAQYDPELLLLFKQAAKELGDPTGFFKVHHNGPRKAGTVHFKDLNCWGLIMPYVDYISNASPPELTTLNGE